MALIGQPPSTSLTLNVSSNSDYEAIIQLRNQDNTVFDLTSRVADGLTFLSQVRRYARSPLVLTTPVVVVDGGPALGKIKVNLTYLQAQAIKYANTAFDIVMLTGGGKRERAVKGVVVLEFGVSR